MRIYRRSTLTSILLIANAFGGSLALAAYDELHISNEQFSRTATALQAALQEEGGMFATSAIASLDSDAEPVVRLESFWALRFADANTQLRMGDTVSNPGSWGTAVRFAGIQFGVPFTPRSDLIFSEHQALAGLALVPTAVDALLVNNNVAPSAVAQRGLSLAKVPALAGQNRLAFTARDATGRSYEFVGPLLAKYNMASLGCSNYSVGIGRARQDFALISNRYGPVFANTTVACGLSKKLTVELHGEYLEGSARIAGIDVIRALGALGTGSLAVATSRNEEGTGWLVRAGVQHSGEYIDMSLRARVQSPEYRELGATESDPVERRLLASIGAHLTDRSSTALVYTNQTTFALQRADILAMQHKIELGPQHGTISFITGRSIQAAGETSVRLSYARSFFN